MPKTVLVIDPVAINRIRLAAMLEEAHYAVVAAAAPGDLAPGPVEADLVILGFGADPPGRAMAGLAGLVDIFEIPLLCLDGEPTPMRRLMVLRAGAREVLPRLTPDGLILARLRGLIREGEAQRECERRRMTAASFGFAERTAVFDRPARVGCIGAPVGLVDMLASALPHDVGALTPAELLKDAPDRVTPEATVLACDGDAGLIDTLLPELRDRSHARHVPVLVLYPADRPDIATRALALGANEIASASASGEELALRIETMLARKRLRDMLRRSEEQSYRMAATDPLTGLYNRRYAEAYLGDLMMRASETGHGFVLMIVDLDHFKAVNDTFGHVAGDRVLCEVAHRLRDNLRACDLVSRHGGEEFLIVLPETGLEQARHTAERLRRAISAAPVEVGAGRQVTVTASIGAASAGAGRRVARRRTGTWDVSETVESASLARVFEAADAALYRAKDAGRDRIEFSAGGTS